MTVNYLGGVRGLLERWKCGGRALDEKTVTAGATGNLNIHGSTSDTAAYIFAPHEPQFLGALEPRIRPLVVALIDAMGWVTYSSCQGHPATTHSPSRPAAVGLLARHPEEAARQHAVLSRLAKRASACAANRDVCVRVTGGTLETEDGPYPCVDLQFHSTTGDEAAYFAVIDDVVASLTRLVAESASAPRATSCRPAGAVDLDRRESLGPSAGSSRRGGAARASPLTSTARP
jgi:uncharacterized protein